jgi:hypothetical protein
LLWVRLFQFFIHICVFRLRFSVARHVQLLRTAKFLRLENKWGTGRILLWKIVQLLARLSAWRWPRPRRHPSNVRSGAAEIDLMDAAATWTGYRSSRLCAFSVNEIEPNLSRSNSTASGQMR